MVMMIGDVSTTDAAYRSLLSLIHWISASRSELVTIVVIPSWTELQEQAVSSIVPAMDKYDTGAPAGKLFGTSSQSVSRHTVELS